MNNRSATNYEIMEPITCYNCFEKGHLARECPKPKRPKFCTSCRIEGHGTRECPNLTVNMSSLSSSNRFRDATLKAISINGVHADALVDTAADISVIKYRLAKKINVFVESKNNIASIRGIGGGLTQSLGICTVNVAIDNLILKDVKLYVVKDNAYQGSSVIIGKDLIDSPDLVMIRKEGKSRLFHKDEFRRLWNIEIDESSQPSDHTLRLRKDQVILKGVWSTKKVDSIKYPDIKNDKENRVAIAKKGYKEKIKIDDIMILCESDTNEQKQCGCDLLNKFRKSIYLNSDDLGCVNNTIRNIVEKVDHSSVPRSPSYRASPYEQPILQDVGVILESKDQGIVRDNSYEHSSPVLLGKKKTDAYVIDCNQLYKFSHPHAGHGFWIKRTRNFKTPQRNYSSCIADKTISHRKWRRNPEKRE